MFSRRSKELTADLISSISLAVFSEADTRNSDIEPKNRESLEYKKDILVAAASLENQQIYLRLMSNSVRLLFLPAPAAFLTASETADKRPGLVLGEIGEESRASTALSARSHSSRSSGVFSRTFS